MKGKRAAPSTKTSDAKATPALVREYDDDFIVTAVPSEKKNKMDVKFNYHVEINEYVKPDFVECSSRKPRRNLSRAQKRPLTCRTTKEIMDDQQWVLQSKLGMTRARAIGILMDDFDEFSDVDEVHVILGPKNDTTLKINSIEYLENNNRAEICYEEIIPHAELVMKVLGLMGNSTASRTMYFDGESGDEMSESDDGVGTYVDGPTKSPRKAKKKKRSRRKTEFNRMMEEMDIKLDKEKSDGAEIVGEPPVPPPDGERDVIIRRGQLEAEAEKLKEIKLKKEKEKKAKAEAAEKKKSEASSRATPALVREYDDDFIVTAVPSEKKNKMDVKFNYHVEINEYVKPDFVECSNQKPRSNLSRAQKRPLTCRTTKEIMDDQQWVLQSKLGMTRARAIGILMGDFNEFSGVDEVHVILGPKNDITLKINSIEYLENNNRAEICYEAELVMKVLGLMGNSTASRTMYFDGESGDEMSESDDGVGTYVDGPTKSPRKAKKKKRSRRKTEFNRMMEEMDIKLDKEKSDGAEIVGEPPVPPPDGERDVIIRRGQLEAEAEKLKEIKLKEEKEKKAKAEAAEKKMSETKIHQKMKDERKRKRVIKIRRRVQAKMAAKTLLLAWERSEEIGYVYLRHPTTHEPRKLNHARDHGDRECLSATRDANDLIDFKKHNIVSPATPSEAQKFLDALERLKRNVMPDIAAEENVTIHFWISFAFLITGQHPYHVWVEGNFAERMAEAIRSVDKMATRPIFVSLCKDSRFHGIPSGIREVATDSADILRSFGIMVTTDDGMWRLMYGHAGNHYMNNHNMPDRLGVKFLFRQRVLLMCSLNVEALSHFGTVRVPRDRVKQIFTGKRGRQYIVIREEFSLETGKGTYERFAYRVSKDYGNVFYKDCLKMVLGNDFMGYPDVAAEKCGDVVEMWLGMLDLSPTGQTRASYLRAMALTLQVLFAAL
ncbi:unnamed protein product [Cladocopium goreaui]|uniref:Uncharacterized protein n=1 Tax=Cladocopium goreaui TaxID=2562237 RepID=A0A9P1FZY1_9DINO|nr:unnamed protein product [Cladocopium goreaui]